MGGRAALPSRMVWSRPLLLSCGAGWLALSISACEEAAGEQVVEENAGEVCLYKLGTELVIRVTRRGCLSSTCDIDRRAECTVTVNGSDVTVDSRFSFTSIEGDCTFDCGTVVGRCTAPLPPDGPLTVHFGGQSRQVVRDAAGMGLFGEPREGVPGRVPCSMPPHLI